MIHPFSSIVPLLAPKILAQTDGFSPFESVRGALGADIGSSLLNLVQAILILIVGWIIALIAKAIVKGLLKKTQIDNKIASWITGGGEGSESIPIEDWIAGVVYWLILLFAIVAFLQALELDAVSEPLNVLLGQVTSFLPKLAGAAILLGVAWLIATLVKLLVSRGLRTLRLDERLGQQVGEGREQNQYALSDTIANALYWFIFLLFLPLILDALELEGTLAPVLVLLNEILAMLPNILGALLIVAAGWLVAQIVRRVVTNLLAATGADRIGTRFGLSGTTQSQSLSWIIGTIVYVLILIPVAVAALNTLEIEAISAPAIAMLNQIFNLLPKLFAAAVVLILAYIAGKYIYELLTNILTGIGFNNVYQWIGIPEPRTRPTPTPDLGVPTPETGQPTTIQPGSEVPRKTPSELVGIIVWVGIVLFGVLAAVNILEIEALTVLVAGIVVISGQILAGLIVFAIGLYLANLAFNLIVSSGSRQSRILGQAARIAIIALVTAMALQQMGIAESIVNLAFGLLFGAVAVAIALAFGLGTRDIANEQVREWLSSFKRND
ncbi:mechanosensitive ion channel [Oscillatoria salina IIICB1]|nr:mechanosensitive ion channel [Oscillatoria salina IIICB1]NET88275.1 mechanosensitive ion channel [Kamptonema sp. SIO1D9]